MPTRGLPRIGYDLLWCLYHTLLVRQVLLDRVRLNIPKISSCYGATPPKLSLVLSLSLLELLFLGIFFFFHCFEGFVGGLLLIINDPLEQILNNYIVHTKLNLSTSNLHHHLRLRLLAAYIASLSLILFILLK